MLHEIKRQLRLACSEMPGLPLIVSFALLSAAIALQFLNADVGKQLTAEGGLIENFSAIIWGLGVAVALVALAQGRSAVWLAGSIMLAWACLRELDIQTAFTYRSIESIGYYARPIAPLGEKLLVMAAMAPFAIAGVYLASRVWRDLRKQRFADSIYGGHVMLGFILLSVGMACEKLLSFTIVEEVAELGLAFDMLLLATTCLPVIRESAQAHVRGGLQTVSYSRRQFNTERQAERTEISK